MRDIDVILFIVPCPQCGRDMKQIDESYMFICTRDGAIFELTDAHITGLCGKMADNGKPREMGNAKNDGQT